MVFVLISSSFLCLLLFLSSSHSLCTLNHPHARVHVQCVLCPPQSESLQAGCRMHIHPPTQPNPTQPLSPHMNTDDGSSSPPPCIKLPRHRYDITQLPPSLSPSPCSSPPGSSCSSPVTLSPGSRSGVTRHSGDCSRWDGTAVVGDNAGSCVLEGLVPVVTPLSVDDVLSLFGTAGREGGVCSPIFCNSFPCRSITCRNGL